MYMIIHPENRVRNRFPLCTATATEVNFVIDTKNRLCYFINIKKFRQKGANSMNKEEILKETQNKDPYQIDRMKSEI